MTTSTGIMRLVPKWNVREMDTDSLNMALRTCTLIKPNLRGASHREWDQWFPGQACDQHSGSFRQAQLQNRRWNSSQCQQHVRFGRRTLGLLERRNTTGEGVTGLCSFGIEGDQLSFKDITKQRNSFTKDTRYTRKTAVGVKIVVFAQMAKVCLPFCNTRISLLLLHQPRSGRRWRFHISYTCLTCEYHSCGLHIISYRAYDNTPTLLIHVQNGLESV